MGVPEKQQYAPPPGLPPDQQQRHAPAPAPVQRRPHTNKVIEAARIRAQDEQEFQQMLQTVQLEMGIYNPEIEPEHETEGMCGCGACRFKWAKRNRSRTHRIWSEAVLYPGEKTYSNFYGGQNTGMPLSGAFLSNPYQRNVVSPYGAWGASGGSSYGGYYGYGRPQPSPAYHEQFILQTIQLNKDLNGKAQAAVDRLEPGRDIWEGIEDETLDFSKLSIQEPPTKQPAYEPPPIQEIPDGDDDMSRAIRESLQDDKKPMSREEQEMEAAIQASLQDQRPEKSGWHEANGASNGVSGGAPSEKSDKLRNERDHLDPPHAGPSSTGSLMTNASTASSSSAKKAGRFSRIFGSSQVKADHKQAVRVEKDRELAYTILEEERGRWPDAQTRNVVAMYQVKTGMARKIAFLRSHQPIQYLHLLRAGYFEPIQTQWADSNSNPLKFSIEAAGGWRGITPAWRGYEDTAEERLYWVLNHREGSAGLARLKPDFISEMNMAMERMRLAEPPPPIYATPDDQCHVQHTSEGYSKQVMPPAFHPYDRPITPSDDTMILLDASGSMSWDPIYPIYSKYLIVKYAKSVQPKNQVVAKAIIRRFTEAMAHHDHLRSNAGYDLVQFSSHAQYVGRITHDNFDEVYSKVRVGGQTRVMTGWQKVKQLHFEKHRESATYHPTFGWQAGPQTPMLRLLLLLDGEASDMDEFELDLMSLNWAHITIFLVGVDGCPHHHRHANELSRISQSNHHVSFVDAVGNMPERYVTHELLKRHLGQDLSYQQFQQLEELPAYQA